MDFTDMIEGALHTVRVAPGAPAVILAEEVQDLSALEYALLCSWARQASALIVVGDPYQALYIWRGADPSMFTDPAIPDDHRRVLGQSYRVPRRVHAAAVRWIRGLSDFQPIKYLPRDTEGLLGTVQANHRHPGAAIELATSELAKGRSIMISVSCAYLLRPTLAALRLRGVPFAQPWCRDRAEWNPLTTKMASAERALLKPITQVEDSPTQFPFGFNNGECRPRWSAAELAEWIEPCRTGGLLRSGAKAEITHLAKQSPTSGVRAEDIGRWFEPDVQPLITAHFHGRAEAAEAVTWYEQRVSAARQDAVRYPLAVVRSGGTQALGAEPRLYVSTIHSFKGAEADVVIVYPDLSPSGMRAWVSAGQGHDGVVRAFYVAVTRARESSGRRRSIPESGRA